MIMLLTFIRSKFTFPYSNFRIICYLNIKEVKVKEQLKIWDLVFYGSFINQIKQSNVTLNFLNV